MKHDMLDTALFCGVLGTFLLGGVLLPDADFSAHENRTLQQRPVLSAQAVLSGDFARGMEIYIADQFPLRDRFVEAKSVMERLWGKRENNGVYHAGDRLIERFDAPDPTRLAHNLAAVDRLAQATDVPVYLALAPTAACIQADRLPAGAPSADQAALLAQIAAGVDVPMIDLRAALDAHAEEYLFYRTDHHWTTLGAYYGAGALLQALGQEIAPLTQFAPVRVSETFNGTLYSSSGYRDITPDAIDRYVPAGDAQITTWRDGAPAPGALYEDAFLQTKDQYSFFLGGNTPLAVIETGNEGGRLLLVRDSYADSLAPFLLAHFSEIHLFDARYFKQPISQYIAENQIDTAVLLFSLKNFVTDTDFSLAAK